MGKFYEAAADELILYTRHNAWLNASPQQRKTLKKGERATSRLQQLEAKGIDAELPPVDAGAYLLAYLWEVGPVVTAGMGAAPVGWQELEAWQRQCGLQLQPWEVRLLRRMSQAYLTESMQADQPDCPAPWVPEPTEHDRDKVSSDLATALRTLKSTRPKPCKPAPSKSS